MKDFVNLSKLCIAHADGFVLHGKASMEKEVIKEIENSNKPFVSNENGDEEIPYVDFYTKYFS